MTTDELKALVAERRESYERVFESVVTELITKYGCTGIKKDLLYSFPIFAKYPIDADIHRLAFAYSDMAHLANDTLDLCSFFAPSGCVIEISQKVQHENVENHIWTNGPLTDDDRIAAEGFITDELHVGLGREISRATFVESGTDRLLHTGLTYSEQDPYRRKRKPGKRATKAKEGTAVGAD